MIAVDFGGAQRPGRDLPGGESLPLPVQTSFCFGFEEVFEEEFDVTLCLRHVEVDRARPRDSGPTATEVTLTTPRLVDLCCIVHMA